MRTQIVAVAIVIALVSATARAQFVPDAIKPYPLPSAARDALCELAGESDVLILGETHGTQEVPAIAAALLEPLTKLGYGVLALEIPQEDQGPLTDWAMGKTEAVPQFFAKPFADGRGSIQALALIRTALSPPFRWQLICFDGSWQDVEDETPPTSVVDAIAASVQRDAVMASNLAKERSRLGAEKKVLTICGNFHARTSSRSQTQKNSEEPSESILCKLWPSFAAKLQIDHPTWRVRSINIVLHGGGYFAMTSSDDGKTFRVGVQTIGTATSIDEAEAHRLDDEFWDWELNLPHATPATFLAPPINPLDPQPTAPNPEPE